MAKERTQGGVGSDKALADARTSAFVFERSIDLGFHHSIPRSKIMLILNPCRKSVKLERILDDARSRDMVIDLCENRPRRSVVVTICNTFIFSIKSARWLQDELAR